MLTVAYIDPSQVKDTRYYRVVFLRFHSIPHGELPPPAPRDCFGRDEMIEKVIGFAENLEPIALIGAGGIGKTSIALTVLHHTRIEKKFGKNRRFIRCDQFPASRAHFLARLSKVIGAGVENPEDLTPLRPLLSSKEMFIILDNAESIFDPKESGAKEIYSVVDELCQFKKLCVCITSRIMTVPPRCERPEIPTLSVEAACDIFYGIHRNVERSGTINDLLKRLDFHALSIKLLATTASHNGWDHDRLAEEWDARRAQVLQTDYNESLAATIELSLSSPTFLSLGPDARDLLGVVAFFPQGVNEKNLGWLFPTISNSKNIFDKFRVLSLTYRTNGFITMLAPIRDYLSPQDPLSSPFLCATRDRYFHRLSVNVHPEEPGFDEAQWITLEDVNVEHLLNVFPSTDQTSGDIWDTCFHFLNHLYWHKSRQTILASKIEALEDDHPSKPEGLTRLSALFQAIGNHLERKRLLTHALELRRQRGDDVEVAQTLRSLSDVNQFLNLYEEGIQQTKEALAILERISYKTEQARVLKSLSQLLLRDNQLDAAEDAVSRAISLISEKGQALLVCQLHRTLGRIHQSKREREKAIHHLKTALRISSNFNWRDELFWNYYGLAELFLDVGEFEDANTHVEQATSHAVGDAYNLGCAMYMQASIWYRQGRLNDAKTEVTHALEIFEQLGAARDAGNSKDLLQKIEREMKSGSISS
jgi:tetratricopeptide (TPR) repeat protein